MGRPCTYTRGIADTILQRLAEGELLRAICRAEGMPPAPTVCGWVVQDIDGFAERYAQARATGMDMLAEETIEIADDGSNDTYKTEDGEERTNTDVVQRSKLRVDTRKWLVSKLAYRKYGERIDVTTAGDKLPGGDAPDTAAKLASLLAAARARKDGCDLA